MISVDRFVLVEDSIITMTKVAAHAACVSKEVGIGSVVVSRHLEFVVGAFDDVDDRSPSIIRKLHAAKEATHPATKLLPEEAKNRIEATVVNQPENNTRIASIGGTSMIRFVLPFVFCLNDLPFV
jgi:hypothetical protein